MANFTASYVDPSLLSQCRLYALPATEQSLYPFVHVHRTPTGGGSGGGERRDSEYQPSANRYPLRGYLRWSDDGTDSVAADEHDLTSTADSMRVLQPSNSASSLHDSARVSSSGGVTFVYVPSAHTHCRRDSVSYERPAFYHGAEGGVSFIQTASYLKMLGAALSGVMDIFTDTIMDINTKHLEHTLMSEVTRVVNQRTTPQVVDLTWPPLRHNITNTVTDAVVQKTVAALAKSMPNALGPYIVETVFDEVVPHAYNSLSKLLTQDISMELIRVRTPIDLSLSGS